MNYIIIGRNFYIVKTIHHRNINVVSNGSYVNNVLETDVNFNSDGESASLVIFIAS